MKLKFVDNIRLKQLLQNFLKSYFDTLIRGQKKSIWLRKSQDIL